MKINKVGYKSMPGGNPYNRPILMKDGKVIDQDATVIEDKVIADGMRYIAKMTKGLATGVLSQDEEYIELQNKIIDELIEKKSFETRSKIEKESKKTINQYANAHKCHQEVLEKMYVQSAQIAKDNSLSFYVNDKNEVYQINSTGPIGCVDKMGGGWRRINLKELKKNIEDRLHRQALAEKEKQVESNEEKIDNALNEFNKPKTKKKSKVVKHEKIVDITKSKAKKKSTKKGDCPFDLENLNCNSKVANSKYEKVLKASPIHKDLEKKAIAKKKVAKKKTTRVKKRDRK